MASLEAADQLPSRTSLLVGLLQVCVIWSACKLALSRHFSCRPVQSEVQRSPSPPPFAPPAHARTSPLDSTMQKACKRCQPCRTTTNPRKSREAWRHGVQMRTSARQQAISSSACGWCGQEGRFWSTMHSFAAASLTLWCVRMPHPQAFSGALAGVTGCIPAGAACLRDGGTFLG